MKRLFTAMFAAALFAGACSGSEPMNPADTGAVYAAALHELITRDTTFGEGFRFDEILIQENLDPQAGNIDADGVDATRPLTQDERLAIEASLADFSIRWIGNPAVWITDDRMPVVDGSAIVGVGVALADSDGVLVPISLWCGGLCGLWATYRLVEENGLWVATGFEGQIAMS